MSHEKLQVVAAGGGAPNKSGAAALTEAVEMADARKPRVLIIPSAKTSLDAHEKSLAMARDLYHRRLGLEVAVLHDFDIDPSASRTEHEIGAADVVYISGGDTDRMMNIWHRSGTAEAIGNAALNGELVLSGISAGAIAPFEWGHSDSLSYREGREDDWDYIPVNGLGLIRAAITPHYNNTNDRLGKRADSFRKMFGSKASGSTRYTGFGIDNFAALKISEGIVSPIYSNPDHRVTVLETDNGELTSHVLESSEEIPIVNLRD